MSTVPRLQNRLANVSYNLTSPKPGQGRTSAVSKCGPAFSETQPASSGSSWLSACTQALRVSSVTTLCHQVFRRHR